MDIVDELRGTQRWADDWRRKMRVAADEIERLRAELAECRELLRRAYGYTTAAADLLPEEINAALASKED